MCVWTWMPEASTEYCFSGTAHIYPAVWEGSLTGLAVMIRMDALSSKSRLPPLCCCDYKLCYHTQLFMEVQRMGIQVFVLRCKNYSNWAISSAWENPLRISACHAPWSMEPAWPWSSHELEADSSFLCSRICTWSHIHRRNKEACSGESLSEQAHKQTLPDAIRRHVTKSTGKGPI